MVGVRFTLTVAWVVVPPPLSVMVGAEVYPEPGLVTFTLVTVPLVPPERTTVTARPLPPVPALLMVTVGADV